MKLIRNFFFIAVVYLLSCNEKNSDPNKLVIASVSYDTIQSVSVSDFVSYREFKKNIKLCKNLRRINVYSPNVYFPPDSILKITPLTVKYLIFSTPKFHFPDSCYHFPNIKSVSILTDTIYSNSCSLMMFDSVETIEVITNSYTGNNIQIPKTVKKISIGGKFTKLPPFIANCDELEYLIITSDSLFNIPQELHKLKKLQLLDITNTQIGKLLIEHNSASMKELEKLQSQLPQCSIIYNAMEE